MKAKILLITFIFLFIGLIARLFYWQIYNQEGLGKSAKKQYQSNIVTNGLRGDILASDETFLAKKSDSWLVYIDTTKIKNNASSIAYKIAPLIQTDENVLKELLTSKKSWIPLAKKVDDNTKKNIEALGIRGIGFDFSESRYYPEASSAAQLLGFLGKDDEGQNIGYFGLEGYYNLPLSGKEGFEGGLKDAKGSSLLVGKDRSVDASNGIDLITSIDKRIQLLIEEKLKMGIEKYGAMGGSISVMDPYTGNILAMASLPTFDPAKYEQYSNETFKNPVITDTFEPGSIFKVVVVASGLDAGVIEPDTKCDICGSPLKIDKYEIKTWNNKYTEGIDMTNIIVHSDNVGMAFIGQKLGADRLYDYLDSFGFGKKTGIDLQGEVAPKMREKGTWNVVDLATTTFGQGIAVSGIEMLRAVSAIANGGNLVKPRVVIGLKAGSWQENIEPEKPTRILGNKAARETALMMVEAVNQGEAKWAKPVEFNNIAGKTGTAQIPVAGHYDPTNTNHSFIGFAPYDNPKLVMLVTLKSPQSSPWAAETAAPLWFTIAKDLFPYLGVRPD